MNETPLIVVVPYHTGDYDLAKQLLEWIVELGSCKPHSIMLAADDKVPTEKMIALSGIAAPVFQFTKTAIVSAAGSTWPPNVMFLQAARTVMTNYRFPFLWLEPDCIPLSLGWLQKIAAEYAMCPRRFMGPLIHQEGQEGLPADHLTGCSVYPNDAYELFKGIEPIVKGSSAWDIGGAAQVVPKAFNTQLIHHFWGLKDLPPVFVEARKPDDAKNFVTLDFIRPGAVVFHRSKGGELIKLLRAKRDKNAEPLAPATSPTPPVKPAPAPTAAKSQTPNPALKVAEA